MEKISLRKEKSKPRHNNVLNNMKAQLKSSIPNKKKYCIGYVAICLFKKGMSDHVEDHAASETSCSQAHQGLEKPH